MKCINWFLLFIAFIKLPQSVCPPSALCHPIARPPPLPVLDFRLLLNCIRIAVVCAMCVSARMLLCIHCEYYNTISNKRNTNTCIGHIFCLQPISPTLSLPPSFALYHTHHARASIQCNLSLSTKFQRVVYWQWVVRECVQGPHMHILCIHSIQPSTSASIASVLPRNTRKPGEIHWKC